jgi:galactokinase/mevalonate kinase-like predicted kinase
MIRASAPGRAGIVGNPTDGYGGTVIAVSLSERAQVTLRPAEETLLEIGGHRTLVRDPSDLKLDGSYTDIAKAVLGTFEEAVRNHRFHLSAETTIPVQAGLSGSTAMLVAILGAVLRLLDIPLNRYEIAETARKIEFEVMGVTCGFQDQYMASFGGLNCLDFRGKEPPSQPSTEHRAPSTEHGSAATLLATVEPLGAFVPELPLVLANTGVKRLSGSVHKGLRERWIEGEPAVVQGYERIAAIAREAKPALLAGDWTCLGSFMNENHAIQRDLGGSGEANERLIAEALRAGAWGAKLAGAGHGGTIALLHPDPPTAIRAMEAAGATRVITVAPSEGLIVESAY